MAYDITLIFPNSPFLIDEQVFPPLGILYLASVLRDYGHSVQIIDLASADYNNSVKVDSNVVGISLTTPQRFEAYRIAKQLQREGKTLIAGGPHATYMPEECIDNGFDYAIQGEGEIALLALMLYLTSGMKCKDNILGRTNDIIPLDRLPFPARELIDLNRYHYEIEGKKATTLMTSRGCPYHCSFCARAIRGFRQASSKYVIREIEHLNDMYGIEAFMIFDDVFVASKKRTKELSEHFQDKDYRFRCFARANLIDDKITGYLGRMGVVEVGIGVESGSETILKRNLKGTTPQRNLEAVWALRKAGIRCKAFIIIGLPGETRETIQDTINWIEEARPDDVDFTVFQPLPGSPVFEKPELWGIKFEYNSSPMWYKGTPGCYKSTVSTEHLYAEEIVEIRDELEDRYKDKDKLK